MFKIPFEDCVADPSNRECRYVPGHDHLWEGEGGSHASQIMFFCGHDKACHVVGDESAFRRAVANVEERFAVVGVLEEMEKSLAVLEAYVPRFFAGVSDVYARRGEWTQQVNKNIYRPAVGEGVRSVIRANITKEVEFYHFCKQRLHRQYAALGL